MTTIPTINTVETGRNIRRLRRDRGLSIQDVQNALLVNRQTVFKWQRGDTLPTLDNLVILAELFNVKLDDIVVTAKQHLTKVLLIRESSNGRKPGFEPVNMGSTPISRANVGLSTMAVRQVVALLIPVRSRQINPNGSVAQMVERQPEELRVGSPILSGSAFCGCRITANTSPCQGEIAGSIPVIHFSVRW